MNPLLLDTHVLVWLMEGDERLSAALRSAATQAQQRNALYVSAITPWEIAMLVAKGRLRLKRDVGDWIDAALGLPGVRLAPLLPAISVASTRLPWPVHSDPADHILIATARHMDATLATADQALLRFAEEGWLRCLAAVD